MIIENENKIINFHNLKIEGQNCLKNHNFLSKILQMKEKNLILKWIIIFIILL